MGYRDTTSRLRAGFLLVVLCCLVLAGPTRGQAADAATDPARQSPANALPAAMRRAATHLLAMDDRIADDQCRTMALAALLDAAPGLDIPELLPSSPKMAERILRVVSIDPKSLRAAAWQIQALSLLPDRPDTRVAMERAAALVFKAIRDEKVTATPGGAAGLSAGDLHLAVSALQLADDGMVPVPAEIWKEVEKVLTPAEGSAAKAAKPVVPALEAMTLRETAGMAVTQLRVFDALHADLRKPGEEEKTIAPTLARVAALFKAKPAADDAAFTLCDLLLYTGQRKLAGMLWPEALSAELLRTQRDDGTWGPPGAAPDAVMESTSLAMLVLARANAPVAISKFSYDGQWNGRPRDAANITAWLSDAFDRPLRWQVVSTSDDAAAWDQSPILFMTGNTDPHFAPDTLARLRDYAWRGGLILSSPDNRSGDFTAAIVDHWAPAAFDNVYKPRDLPDDHPVFTLWGKLSSPPRLESTGNSVRELWIHSRSDLGATWHGRRLNTRDQWTFAANLFLYTTGRENQRLPAIHADAPAAKPALALRMARVKYEGNWNPEPLAAASLAEQAAAYGVDLQVVETAPADLDPKTTPLAHMTGTGPLHLSDPDIAGLRKYVEAGGLLLVEAAGGDEAFGKSFAEIARQVTPGAKLAALPLNHPIYNGAIVGSV